MIKKIVSYIKRNQVSTTEVADCLNKSGAIEKTMPLSSGMFKAGPIRYVYGFNESNWSIHEQIREVEAGEVVFIDGINVNGRALIGELVTKFLLLYKQAEAVVVLGKIRDANDLLKNRYAVWCQGISPVGCFNTKQELDEEVRQTVADRKKMYEGAVAVCDDTGVVIIPKDKISEEMYKKLENIEEQEDIWFDCIDRKKWDTYDTVCLKKYKEENNEKK